MTSTLSPTPSAQSSLGLGHPSAIQTSPHFTNSLTPSLSLPRHSASNTLLPPLALARSHYAASAQHFIHREPLESLREVEEARRLLLTAISLDQHSVRNSISWKTTRDKIVILWLTLLVSLWKGRGAEIIHRRQKVMPSQTNELLGRTTPSEFLSGVTSYTLQAYAVSTEEMDAIANEGSALGQTEARPRRILLARLPASVAASLLMAALGVEEAFPSSPPGAIPQIMPISRSLAEELISSLMSSLMTVSIQERDQLLASYSRVIEIYSIHILGVRCAQWEEADQIVRLSLIDNEGRAEMLLNLEKAKEHVTSRPARRASAKLALGKAYELERQKSEREVTDKGDHRTFMQRQTIRAENNCKIHVATPSARPQVGSHRYSSTSSSAQMDSDIESHSTMTGQEGGKVRQRIKGIAAVATHDEETSLRGSTDAGESVAVFRPLLNKKFSKNARRDDNSTALQANSSSRILAGLRSTIMRGLPLPIPVLISVLAPLIVLLFSLRRLALRRRPDGALLLSVTGRTAALLPQTETGANIQRKGLLLDLMQRIRETVRMGTKISYL